MAADEPIDLLSLLERWQLFLSRRQLEDEIERARGRGDRRALRRAERELAVLEPVSPLEALDVNAKLVDILSVQRFIAMKAARDQGATLEDVGRALGVSRQSAWEFMQRKIAERQAEDGREGTGRPPVKKGSRV